MCVVSREPLDHPPASAAGGKQRRHPRCAPGILQYNRSRRPASESDAVIHIHEMRAEDVLVSLESCNQARYVSV